MIHIYTGDGKGKTTAAVGLALRALGAGKRVAFFQFMKAWPSSEIDMLCKCGAVVNREWNGEFIYTKATEEQLQMVKRQYENVCTSFAKKFDVVVLDEIIVTIKFSLLLEDDILALMEKKPKELELVLTGRGATQNLIDKADLVTFMQKRKHYFDKGIKARIGIEY